jgi:carotenoid cleavage dioxygenase
MATKLEDAPDHMLGNGRPVTEEQTVTELNVTGNIPPELDGRYVRAGGNQKQGYSDHPFLGDGMVHGVRLRDGKAEWYRNRWVETPFITNPDLNATDPAVMMDMKSSKANTHVLGHAGKILALEEAHFPYELNADLGTVGVTDFNGKLQGPFTAHPKICPITGELIGFGASFIPPNLRYHRISADGELVQSEEITIGGPVMMHDFNITENYVIFMDLPAVFDMNMAMSGDMPIRWDDDYPPRLGVMPRDGNNASVKWFEINPCYVFHPMNAYEEGDKIILDVARYDYIWRESAMDFPPSSMWRWTIDMTSGKVHEEQVDDLGVEFPRVADDKVGQKHRYGYTMRMSPSDDPTQAKGGVRKYDCETGETSDILYGKGRVGGEPVFAPSAKHGSEDDGYLMTYVYDAATDSSQLVIMDAASMDNEPVAVIDLPRIPSGFHGSWIPSSVVA